MQVTSLRIAQRKRMPGKTGQTRPEDRSPMHCPGFASGKSFMVCGLVFPGFIRNKLSQGRGLFTSSYGPGTADVGPGFVRVKELYNGENDIALSTDG
jgi:hypothetical protein